MDWVSVDGQSMQHAGWQDCMRLARPRQVRHRVRCTWRYGPSQRWQFGAGREAKGGKGGGSLRKSKQSSFFFFPAKMVLSSVIQSITRSVTL